jgi:putative NIF3 family GTP cyclohydrolase 1 type 2
MAANKRKRSRDYRRELLDLKAEQKALEARIRIRALELCKEYPGVRIGEFCANDYLRLEESLLDENIGEGINTTEALMVMEAIEKDLEAKHPHKQTAFQFPTVVPEGPVGERIIFVKGEAYSRMAEQKKVDCVKSGDGKHHFELNGEICYYCGVNISNL